MITIQRIFILPKEKEKLSLKLYPELKLNPTRS